MKTRLTLLVAAAFSLSSLGAIAQTTDASSAEAAKAAKEQKKEDFAKKEKALQDASRSSASGPASLPPTEAKKMQNTKDSGKAVVESMNKMQQFSGSKPVDKNAKATAPMKDLREMTPEERAQLRKEVVKEAKP